MDNVLAVELADLQERIPVNAGSFITQQGAIVKGLPLVIADAHGIMRWHHAKPPASPVTQLGMAAVQSIQQRSATVSGVEES